MKDNSLCYCEVFTSPYCDMADETTAQQDNGNNVKQTHLLDGDNANNVNPVASTSTSKPLIWQSKINPNFAFATPIGVHAWKTVRNKRKISPNAKVPVHKQQKITNYWLGSPAIASSNRFAELEKEDDPIREEIIIPKPPPIMLRGVNNIAPLIEQLNIVAKDGYQTKTTGDRVTIHTRSKEEYAKIIQVLKDKDTMFHSYPFKDARAFRVVLKNVHHTIDTNAIKTALKDIGHDVRNIHNILNRRNKIPLPMFFVDLEPKENNQEIYQVQLLCNMRLKFEPPRPKREIPQCIKCQRYGHTKNYCHHQARCVKCAKFHETATCDRKNEDLDVLCVLCSGNHPANYKGCEIYKELQAKRYPPLRNKNPVSQLALQPSTIPTSRVRTGVSYAQAAREQSQQQQFVNSINQPETPQPSSDIYELKLMMKDLMDSMKSMLNILTALVAKKN